MQSLKAEALDDANHAVIHRLEFARPVPEAVKSKIGYDIEKTLKLFREPLTPRMKELLHAHFDPALAKVRSWRRLPIRLFSFLSFKDCRHDFSSLVVMACILILCAILSDAGSDHGV